MNARQAKDLLELIADLYHLANEPEPTPAEPPPGIDAVKAVHNHKPEPAKI